MKVTTGVSRTLKVVGTGSDGQPASVSIVLVPGGMADEALAAVVLPRVQAALELDSFKIECALRNLEELLRNEETDNLDSDLQPAINVLSTLVGKKQENKGPIRLVAKKRIIPQELIDEDEKAL